MEESETPQRWGMEGTGALEEWVLRESRKSVRALFMGMRPVIFLSVSHGSGESLLLFLLRETFFFLLEIFLISHKFNFIQIGFEVWSQKSHFLAILVITRWQKGRHRCVETLSLP